MQNYKQMNTYGSYVESATAERRLRFLFPLLFHDSYHIFLISLVQYEIEVTCFQLRKLLSLWDCLSMVLLILFETAATFSRLIPFFVADVAGSLEAHVLTFLDLTFVPLGSLLPF